VDKGQEDQRDAGEGDQPLSNADHDANAAIATPASIIATAIQHYITM